MSSCSTPSPLAPLQSLSPPPSVVVSDSSFPAVSLALSAYRVVASQCLRCSAHITDDPLERLLQIRLITHSISSSSGTKISTRNGFTEMGMFFPRGGTYVYSATLSAVICSRVTRAGSGVRLTAALYHPLIPCHASWIKGGGPPTAVPQTLPPPPPIAVSYPSSNLP